MSRFKSVWIVAAALAVTALGVRAVLLFPVAVHAFAERVRPGFEGTIGAAVLFAVTTIGCGAVGLIIALTSGRAKSRSAGNSAPDGGGEPGLGSAHYPRSRLRRGKWPGADRRYVP